LQQDGEAVAEPMASNIHVLDAKLQLLKLVIEFWAVKAERGPHDNGYTALKNLSKAATAAQGEGMQAASAAAETRSHVESPAIIHCMLQQ